MDKFINKAVASLQHHTELPNTNTLKSYDHLSIKLVNEEPYTKAVHDFKLVNTFTEPIPFQIRDEANKKHFVFSADLHANRGLLVKCVATGEEIMLLTLADSSKDIIGKIQHPTAATLYKIHTSGAPGEFRVCKRDANETPVLFLRRRQRKWLVWCKRMDLVNDDSATKILTPGGQVLARVLPKVRSTNQRVHMLNILPNVDITNEQRAICLAVALLQSLSISYPEIYRLFEETKKQ